MMRTVHFISGLPRSGSTLLAALLRQNPRFHSDITGPVALLCSVVHQRIGGTGEYSVLFDDARCAHMLRSIFDAYYSAVPQSNVIFDTNRSWTSKVPLLDKLYPNSKIICCVRDIGWIIDSVERMRNKHPLKLSKLFSPQVADSLYSRVEALMNSETGLVGVAWSNLREAWFSETAGRLIVVTYDSLVGDPAATLRRIYEEIGEPPFAHEYKNVRYEAPEYDNNLGMPGLHTVHPVVEARERQPTIPPDIFVKYAKTQFWENPDLNPHHVLVL
jgi:sulfotransferase